MARLGELERAVMEVLWATPGWHTARAVADTLAADRELAYTTVLTVLDRLEHKGFVVRERAGRAHRYAAAASREAYVAEAMMEALDSTEDRQSALVRFVGSVSPAEADLLRRALDADPADAVDPAAPVDQDTQPPPTDPVPPGDVASDPRER